MAKNAKKESVLNDLRPIMNVSSKKELSGYVMKDIFFDKKKIYIDKASGIQKELDADWRHLNLFGEQITLFKGVELTKSQLACFDEKGIEYFLEKTSKKKEPKTDLQVPEKEKIDIEMSNSND